MEQIRSVILTATIVTNKSSYPIEAETLIDLQNKIAELVASLDLS